jgi:hypothetical protein
MRISRYHLKRLLLTGWKSEQIFLLAQLKNDRDEELLSEEYLELSRLRFVKWLVETGRLRDDT